MYQVRSLPLVKGGIRRKTVESYGSVILLHDDAKSSEFGYLLRWYTAV